MQCFKRRLKKIAWCLPMRPLTRFLYAYVLRFGFLDGRPGLYFCGLPSLSMYFFASANRYEQRLIRRILQIRSVQCRDFDEVKVACGIVETEPFTNQGGL